MTGQAYGHVERASYWPDPGVDRSSTPPAGGKVPDARSLFTALKKSPPGVTRVVCAGAVPSTRAVKRATERFRAARKGKASKARISKLRKRVKSARRSYNRKVRRNPSIRKLSRHISQARKSGFKDRPSQPARKLSKKAAARLLAFNKKLLARCRYKEIQPAVTRSRNNDRVVIMPGLYTEPTSRSKPTDDKSCANLKMLNDRNNPAALSYQYHVKCPNDANLIAVAGREIGSGSDPKAPRFDRHGIPNLGDCLRCNLQLEGSGINADDVVIDAGRVESGNGGPAEPKKDVGIFVDRADGFVLRGMTVRHVTEHGIYALEVDGYRLERFKTFHAEEYGVLTFVSDHGLMQDCEAAGSGDAGLYPGSAPDTGSQTIEDKPRMNTEIRECDMHHNAAGYSGTAANAVHIHRNDFYDNALGFTTDVFTAAGHPGFPQDSDLVEHNDFYSNNFNPFAKGSDVVPTIPVPVGTGMWIAGGNNNIVRRNRFWDNHRRGIMLFTVPDAFVCGEGPLAGGNQQAGCSEGKMSTSYDNRFYENHMGRRPDGTRDPNGVDFWWDSFPNQGSHNPPTTTGNCWYDNIGKEGTGSSITSSPPRAGLPSNCAASNGTSHLANELELLNCFADFEDDLPDLGPCNWFTAPPEPG